METKIWFDGRLVAEAEARISVLAHALHYGTSVFEGIRAYATDRGPAVFRLREHSQRLLDSAKIMDMKVGYDVGEVDQAIIDTVNASGHDSCYIRPLLFYGANSLGVNPRENPVHFIVATLPWGAYLGDEAVRKGARLMTSSWRRSAPDILPTKAKAGGNYVNSVLANQEAVRRGYDEALLLDHQGFVAEGSGENVFMIRDGVVQPIAHSVNLRGITRDSAVQLARHLGLKVEPVMATRDELYTADEVFMTGTAAEVTPVASIDDRAIGSGAAGEITMRIREAFMDAVSGNISEFSHWLTHTR